MDSPASNETPNAGKADARSSVGKLVKIIGSLTTIIAALTVFLNNPAGLRDAFVHLFSANSSPSPMSADSHTGSGSTEEQRPHTPSAAELYAQAQPYYNAQDYVKAAPLLTQSAEKGNTGAMSELGWLYEVGYGVAQDYGKAQVWYLEGADAGNRDAMFRLGYLYQHGHGVDLDYAKARDWYEKAAFAGHTDAMCALAEIYAHGPIKSYEVARRWYEKAIASGDVMAMQSLQELEAEHNSEKKGGASER
jgi:TPR repeat protein